MASNARRSTLPATTTSPRSARQTNIACFSPTCCCSAALALTWRSPASALAETTWKDRWRCARTAYNTHAPHSLCHKPGSFPYKYSPLGLETPRDKPPLWQLSVKIIHLTETKERKRREDLFWRKLESVSAWHTWSRVREHWSLLAWRKHCNFISFKTSCFVGPSRLGKADFQLLKNWRLVCCGKMDLWKVPWLYTVTVHVPALWNNALACK